MSKIKALNASPESIPEAPAIALRDLPPSIRTPDYGIPERLLEPMREYVARGQRPGHFMSALLANNLAEAVGRADSINLPLLPRWVQYMYFEIPSQCWGSVENREAWIDRFTRSSV